MHLYKFVIVGAGGFIGASSRYFVEKLLSDFGQTIKFPLGTFCVNLVGCFLIGLLGYFFVTRSDFNTDYRLFLAVGILGGFTTFSSFGFEIFMLLKAERANIAFIYALLSLVLGVLLIWLGFSLAKLIFQ